MQTAVKEEVYPARREGKTPVCGGVCSHSRHECRFHPPVTLLCHTHDTNETRTTQKKKLWTSQPVRVDTNQKRHTHRCRRRNEVDKPYKKQQRVCVCVGEREGPNTRSRNENKKQSTRVESHSSSPLLSSSSSVVRTIPYLPPQYNTISHIHNIIDT